MKVLYLLDAFQIRPSVALQTKIEIFADHDPWSSRQQRLGVTNDHDMHTPVLIDALIVEMSIHVYRYALKACVPLMDV